MNAARALTLGELAAQFCEQVEIAIQVFYARPMVIKLIPSGQEQLYSDGRITLRATHFDHKQVKYTERRSRIKKTLTPLGTFQ